MLHTRRLAPELQTGETPDEYKPVSNSVIYTFKRLPTACLGLGSPKPASTYTLYMAASAQRLPAT